MLSLIYISYFCTEEKKEKIIKLENENINNFYKKEIFEKTNKQEKVGTKELGLVEYRESLLKNIFNKIFIKKYIKNKDNKF